MATIATLIARFDADIAPLAAGVEKGANTLGRMEASARQLGAAIGAAFSIEKIAAAASKTVEATSALADLSAKAGVTAEAFQELAFAAEQNGGSAEQMATVMAKLGNTLTEAPKDAVKAFKEIGLSVEDLRAMAPDQAFQAIAEKVATIEDPMMRSKIAMDIFGKAGGNLLPIIASDIGALRDQARDMGIVLSNDVVAAGDAAGDSWDAMQKKLDGLMAKGLTPVLKLFLAMPEPLQAVTGLAINMAPALQGIGVAIIAAGGPVAALGMLSSAFAVVAPWLLPAGVIIAGIIAVYEAWKHWDKITALVSGVYTAVKTWMVDKFIAAKDSIINTVTAIYTGVKTWLVDRFTAIVDSVKAKIDAVTGFFGNMYDAVVGHSYVPDMMQGIEREFGKLDSIMRSPTQAATRAVTTLFEDMMQSITGKLTDWFPGLSAIFSGGLGLLFSAAMPLVVEGVKKVGEWIWDGLKWVGGKIWDGIKSFFGFGGPDRWMPGMPERPALPGETENPGMPWLPSGGGPVTDPWENPGLPGTGEGGPMTALTAGGSSALMASGGGGGGTMVIHNYVMLDGKQVGKSTKTYQDQRHRLRHKVRAA